jgi:hypothetical protein
MSPNFGGMIRGYKKYELPGGGGATQSKIKELITHHQEDNQTQKSEGS